MRRTFLKNLVCWKHITGVWTVVKSRLGGVYVRTFVSVFLSTTMLLILLLTGCMQTSEPPAYPVEIVLRLVEAKALPGGDDIIQVTVVLSKGSEQVYKNTFEQLPEQIKLYMSPGTYTITVTVDSSQGKFIGVTTTKLVPGENVVTIALQPAQE